MTIGHAWEPDMFEGVHALTTPIRTTDPSDYRKALIMSSTALDFHNTDRTGRVYVMTRLREIGEDWAYDPYGSGMLALGVAVDVLADDGVGIPSAIATGPMGIDWDSVSDTVAQELWQEMADGLFSSDDLRYGMFVLSRYIDIVRIAGRSY